MRPESSGLRSRLAGPLARLAVLLAVVDDQTGAVSFANGAAGDVHDVTDEIARRAWLRGARALAVRNPDVPGDGEVAAILRYPL